MRILGRGRRLAKVPYAKHLMWLEPEAMGGTRLDLDEERLEGLRARALDLRRIRLANCSAAGADFEHARLDGAEFHGCDLSGATFARSSMAHASVEGGVLRGADLRHANLQGSELSRFEATDAALERAALVDVKATGVVLAGANMTDVVLDGSRWTDCDLRGARLVRERRDLDLGRGRDVVFERCDLRDTEWTGFRLDDVRFIECRFHDTRGPPRIEGPWSAEGTDGSEPGDGTVTWTRDQLAGQWNLDASAGEGATKGASPSQAARPDPSESGRDLMRAIAEALNDPATDGRIAAREEARERRQSLIIEGSRAVRQKHLAREIRIRDARELRLYLWKRESSDVPEGVRFQLESGEGEKKAALARWRSDPGEIRLSSEGATVVVRLGDDGAVSSLALEEALSALAQGAQGPGPPRRPAPGTKALEPSGRLADSIYRAHQTWLVANGAAGARLELHGEKLDGVQADASDLRRIRMTKCSLAGANFEYARLDGAELRDCDLTGAVLGRGSTEELSIEGGSLRGADLRLGSLRGSRLVHVDATNADLQRARLDDVTARGVVLSGARLADVVLDGSRWTDCDFRGARLVRATTALPLGTAYDVVFERCDFRGTEWTGFRLRDVHFHECRLHDARGRPEIEGGWTAVKTDGSQAGDGSVAWSRDDVAAQWDVPTSAESEPPAPD